ncbi:DUF3501 family protein [Ferrovum myxofaciens]|jgi:hypothetical protein|uniref:DUF3501 family protein n=3 Tax=root TaxID=1 RepID=A0A859A8N5_9PROT|nr:DUF3501 family protein [Ferrovum myxofaciens]MBW8028879.1 DUF3501 family protein [Ferrovum sp.]KXW57658.1 hypothetical protein FEMY_18090 [Ferrovum myxofaciens]MBU6994685.1 DUF3501 family protein [Ferrovum myxofaciens]QKE38536.1 MAG: DUF3501 family protein [Ferrovum myxofaciens]QWY73728.1 MAG: DUF3501 family protein [Ferrovum myxofaciens]
MSLTLDDLWSLESYARQRPEFRARVMAHKKQRTVHVGKHLTLLFEDRLTIQYQIQEMLRIEKIFEPESIREELASYVSLIPDGDNWKATLLIEYSEVTERKRMLTRLKGIERALWLQVEGFEPVFPVADEDMERETAEKTSAVHFLRYTLSPSQREAVRSGAALTVGVNHPEYPVIRFVLEESVRHSLSSDITA